MYHLNTLSRARSVRTTRRLGSLHPALTCPVWWWSSQFGAGGIWAIGAGCTGRRGRGSRSQAPLGPPILHKTRPLRFRRMARRAENPGRRDRRQDRRHHRRCYQRRSPNPQRGRTAPSRAGTRRRGIHRGAAWSRRGSARHWTRGTRVRGLLRPPPGTGRASRARRARSPAVPATGGSSARSSGCPWSSARWPRRWRRRAAPPPRTGSPCGRPGARAWPPPRCSRRCPQRPRHWAWPRGPPRRRLRVLRSPPGTGDCPETSWTLCLSPASGARGQHRGGGWRSLRLPLLLRLLLLLLREHSPASRSARRAGSPSSPGAALPTACFSESQTATGCLLASRGLVIKASWGSQRPLPRGR
jgi:hypothetical protein